MGLSLARGGKWGNWGSDVGIIDEGDRSHAQT
ncbi:hypothetical protein LCGC14_2881600, partial [marine sediment metagenome]